MSTTSEPSNWTRTSPWPTRALRTFKEGECSGVARPPFRVWLRQGGSALRALELDDTLAEGHNLLAKVFYYADWNWAAAEREFRRGIELSPNSASLRMTYSIMLGSLLRHQEGMSQIEQAIEMDPLNPLWQVVRAYQMMFLERQDEAIDEFRRMLLVAPNLLPAQEALWVGLWAPGGVR